MADEKIAEVNPKEKFYIGLDIGTESVGFSATDGNYEVLKSGGKPLMGVRLFDEASTAADRRVKRANKVRKNRQKQRIMLLQSLFDTEISKVDPLFFIRLSASSFWEEDKKAKDERLDLNSLFSDDKYRDATYFKKYKSIYHLRNALMDEGTWKKDEKPDIRLVYLACHHILKNRGHFVWEVGDIDENTFKKQGKASVEEVNKALSTAIDSASDEENTDIDKLQINIPQNFEDVLKVFQNEKLGKMKKQEELTKLFFVDENIKKVYKKEIPAILKAITGGNFNLNQLFNFDETVDIDKEDATYSFESVWEETAPKIIKSLSNDDYFAVISALKELYDFAQLESILKGEKSISPARVKDYDKHQKHLRKLKKFIKNVLPKDYNKIFRSNSQLDGELGNYANYIGSNLVKEKQIVKKVEKQGFYDFLLKLLSDNNIIEKDKDGYIIKKELPDNCKECLIAILDGIKQGTFLPKLRTKDNGAIPVQIHKYELLTIFNNASKFYAFLNKEDEDKDSPARTVKDKVLSLISFRVPYDVGRLNTYKGDNKNRPVWAERTLAKVMPVEIDNKHKFVITPWTFDRVIDRDISAKQFIDRMRSKCTYLITEDVLPKHSLLFSKYTVLNELNNVRIDGERVSVELKQDIYTNLFEKQKTVSASSLIKYLKTKDIYKDISKDQISGFDIASGRFNASLSSLITAKPIIDELKEMKCSQKDAESVIEQVILWQSLFTDKAQVERMIRKEYPKFKDSLIKKLKGLNFSGFAKFSRKFLTDSQRIDLQTGEILLGKSIIDILWETQENLMEIIHNKEYKIQEWLMAENNSEDEAFSYADIAESYGAPSVKRAVWQSFKVIDDLIKLNENKIPDKIFVEVTREIGDKKGNKKDRRTSSRKKKIEALYTEIRKINTAISKQEVDELGEQLEKKTDAEMRGEKLFLYFLQCGKCAYSGEPIAINKLSQDYDVDHIIPQSKKKDDGLSNKVLVKKELNRIKGNDYPLNKVPAIWSKIGALKPLWKSWLDASLKLKPTVFSREKFDRLTRTAELQEKELEGFIARQLVFTGQSTTLVNSLLKKKFAKSIEENNVPEIVYSKAGNVSEFRKKFDILKCRDINDLHHAHDAYLNIVVGNTYNQRFNHNRYFYKDNTNQTDKWKEYSQNHLFEYPVAEAWTIGGVRPKKQDFDENEDGKKAYRQAVEEWFNKGETISTVRKVVAKNWYPVTKKVLELKGSFYNETLYGVDTKQKQFKKGKALMKDKATAIPLKGLEENPRHDYKKYGYFTRLESAYYMIVEHTKTIGKGKNQKSFRQRQFIGVPRIHKTVIEKELSGDKATEFLKQYYGLDDGKVIVSKIHQYTLFEIDGTPVRIVGCAGDSKWQNAVQFYVDKGTNDYIRLFAKYKELVKAKILQEDDYKNQTEIIVADSVNKQKITRDKNIELFNIIKCQLAKDIYKGNASLYKKLDDSNAIKFENLDIVEQINVLIDLIKALSCSAATAKIKIIGGSTDYFGKLVLSDKINQSPVRERKDRHMALIEESVTGHKTKRTKIYPFED